MTCTLRSAPQASHPGLPVFPTERTTNESWLTRRRRSEAPSDAPRRSEGRKKCRQPISSIVLVSTQGSEPDSCRELDRFVESASSNCRHDFSNATHYSPAQPGRFTHYLGSSRQRTTSTLAFKSRQKFRQIRHAPEVAHAHRAFRPRGQRPSAAATFGDRADRGSTPLSSSSFSCRRFGDRRQEQFEGAQKPR